MSSNLTWKPVHQDEQTLSDELKHALSKRHRDGIDIRMGRTSIAYLRGLSDAGIKDADKLIEAIERHEEIEVREVY